MFSFFFYFSFLACGGICLAILLARPAYLYFPRSRPFILGAVNWYFRVTEPLMRRILPCAILAVALVAGGCASNPFGSAREYPVNYTHAIPGGTCGASTLEDTAERLASGAKLMSYHSDIKVKYRKATTVWTDDGGHELRGTGTNLVGPGTPVGGGNLHFVTNASMDFAGTPIGGVLSDPGYYRVVLAGTVTCSDGVVKGTVQVTTKNRTAVGHRKVSAGPYSPPENEDFAVVTVAPDPRAAELELSKLSETR